MKRKLRAMAFTLLICIALVASVYAATSVPYNASLPGSGWDSDIASGTRSSSTSGMSNDCTYSKHVYGADGYTYSTWVDQSGVGRVTDQMDIGEDQHLSFTINAYPAKGQTVTMRGSTHNIFSPRQVTMGTFYHN